MDSNRLSDSGLNPARRGKTIRCALLFVCVFAAVGIWPRISLAASSSSSGGLVDVVIVILAFAGAILLHRLDVLFPRLNVFAAGGVEYILLGVVLHQTGITSGELAIQSMAPIITFGVGSVGLLAGLRTSQMVKPKFTSESIRSGLWSSVTTAAFVLGAFLLWHYISVEHLNLSVALGPETNVSSRQTDLIISAILITTTALVSSPEAIASVIASSSARPAFMSRLAFNTARVTQIIGILVFGLLFCIEHQGVIVDFREPTVLEWFFISIGLGVGLGFVFHLFIGKETEDRERLLVAGLGIVVFASGLSYYLALSPILVNFAAGFVLAQFPQSSRSLHQNLSRLEKPALILLFVFAGLIWQPPPWQSWILVVFLLIARFAGKNAGARIGYYYSSSQDRYANGLGLALTAQGGLVAAMVLNYSQVYVTPLSQSVLDAILLALILNELLGRRWVKSMLAAAHELTIDATIDHHKNPLGPDQIDWSGGDSDASTEAEDEASTEAEDEASTEAEDEGSALTEDEAEHTDSALTAESPPDLSGQTPRDSALAQSDAVSQEGLETGEHPDDSPPGDEDSQNLTDHDPERKQ